jgi:carboxyl-terminal processing protease
MPADMESINHDIHTHASCAQQLTKDAIRGLVTAVLIVLLAGCRPQPVTPTPTPTPMPTATPAATPTLNAQAVEYLNVFETVWQTVNDNYFDPDFGGLDWRAEHDRYEPLIAQAENDQALYRLLNQMLWQLGVSHTAAVPAGRWTSVEPVVSAEGTTGLDIRLLGGEAVITRVESGSSAEKAGLQPGFVLQSIDGIAIEQIIAEAETALPPPYNDRGRIEGLTRAILGRVYGTADTSVTIAYLDELSKPHEASLTRIRRERPAVMEGASLPPFFLEFEANRLEQDIGYIRFNTFHPDLILDMQGAIKSMADTRAIIIDLRGNPGGNPVATEALAAQFLKGRAHTVTYLTRGGPIDRFVEPAEGTYEGPLLVLIDALSTSASEEFAAGMQAIGRAVIIGQRSPGSAAGAEVKLLPNGGLLLFATVEMTVPDGTVIEGRGVIPDIQVELERELLLQGIDSQLEAAIDYIKGHSTP